MDVVLKLDADEIIAQGPPWNMRRCVRGTSYLDTEDRRVYENRYVMGGRVAWGLLREYEVYEDAQATKALDEYLSQCERTSVAPTLGVRPALVPARLQICAFAAKGGVVVTARVLRFGQRPSAQREGTAVA